MRGVLCVFDGQISRLEFERRHLSCRNGMLCKSFVDDAHETESRDIMCSLLEEAFVVGNIL